jgi:DNA (cytosine-5)-methyltransferase 1
MADAPRLLDLFCGAGGAAMGYALAGFRVTGIDIAPQPLYPFQCIQADALEYLAHYGQEYDAIHASPPCQAVSSWRCFRD